jgi:Co/Zn/Cd efflux system component
MALEGLRKNTKGIRDIHWGACVYLLDGPKTMEQLRTAYESAPFPMAQSYGSNPAGQWNQRSLERLPTDLSSLLRVGWVTQEGDLFALTEDGRKQVGQILKNASNSTEWVLQKLKSLFRPDVASKVTLIIQVILALIKLPAGLLSGSVGLLNDSADTLLDLLSSLLVYLGIRFNKERLVSILLVAFMLGTGGLTLYEAGARFGTPYVPKVDWFPFAAAILSALAGLFLWTYQRYVGIHSGLMAFITESVDSRNHIIVALGVTAGLAASLLHFGALDMLVGLLVALLILWSAIQLLIDLVRSSADEKVVLSHYGFWLLSAYQHLRNDHLKRWMLTLVDRQEVQTRSELMERTRQAFDYRDNRWMRMMGLDRQFASDPVIAENLDELFSSSWLEDQSPLMLSHKGKKYLQRKNKGRGSRNRKFYPRRIASP